MSRYENLPIYKQAFDFLVYIEDVVKNFSRYHKYSIGEILRNDARNIVMNIVKASIAYNKEKLILLKECGELIEEVKIFLNVSKELKAFNNYKSYHHAIKLVADVGRQNAGWMKMTQERLSLPESQ